MTQDKIDKLAEEYKELCADSVEIRLEVTLNLTEFLLKELATVMDNDVEFLKTYRENMPSTVKTFLRQESSGYNELVRGSIARIKKEITWNKKVAKLPEEEQIQLWDKIWFDIYLDLYQKSFDEYLNEMAQNTISNAVNKVMKSLNPTVTDAEKPYVSDTGFKDDAMYG